MVFYKGHRAYLCKQCWIKNCSDSTIQSTIDVKYFSNNQQPQVTNTKKPTDLCIASIIHSIAWNLEVSLKQLPFIILSRLF